MSRDSTSIDNSVFERFISILKRIRIDKLTLKENLEYEIKKNSNFKSFRSVVPKYIKILNEKPNKKTNDYSPKKRDQNVSFALALIMEPVSPKAYSKHFGLDPRLEYIQKFKDENSRVLKILEQIAKHS